MTEFADIINDKCYEVHSDIEENGFWEDVVCPEDKIPLCIALIHSEVSEALEADRTDAMDDHLKERLGLEVELADAVIRIFDLCGALQLDLGGAIEEKIAYNRTRDYKHSKRY